MTNSARFYIRTYGCQMNSADSARLAALLTARGWRPAATPQESDLIIVNTCSVRDHAEKRALGYLHSLKALKKRGVRFGLYGCIANLQGAGILQRYPFLDIVCGPNRIEESVGFLVNPAASPAGPVVLIGESDRPFISELPPVDDAACDVSITKGCDNHCSYCVVPTARGRLVSKPPAQVLDEVRRLADRGVRQVTLLGQNVNEYGRDITGVAFVDLLEEIHEIEGIRRIHFLTSHPKDMPDSLIRAFTSLPKLCRHLHLPLQSGADRILKLMNRRYTAGDYLAIVDKLRTVAPDTALTSDIIVGFPSESETDFLATYGLIEQTRFDDLFDHFNLFHNMSGGGGFD